jgi:alkylhydroperoxidase/carboxymuconolactone decarboxylase family protein YurZ
MGPWSLEIIVVRNGTHDAAARRALSRDVERGLLVRIRQGAYLERTTSEAMSPEDRHIVRIRAFAAVSPVPPVFAHWSAGASPFDEGVTAAGAALRSGVPREQLEEAAAVAGPRRSGTRIREVIAFAHPGAESAAASGSRVLMIQLGVEPPELQWGIVLAGGPAVFVDFFLPDVRVGGEADGDVKYLDARFAPDGAGRAVVAEKRREDEVRTHMSGLARRGWAESRRLDLMRRVLQRVGVLAATPEPRSLATASERSPLAPLPAPPPQRCTRRVSRGGPA